MDEKKLARIDAIVKMVDTLDYYQIMGLKPDATFQQIKTAYFKLAAQYHPDKYYTLEDRALKLKIAYIYKQLAEAYKVLMDKEKRRVYDQGLAGADGLRVIRYSAPEQDQAGSRNPEDVAATPQGKKYLRMGLMALTRKDYAGAEMNVKFALNYEPDNQAIKAKLEEIKSQAKANPAARRDPHKIF